MNNTGRFLDKRFVFIGVVCSGMSGTEDTDLYRVLGATSGDSVQHIKYKYQQLVLQVNAPHIRETGRMLT